MNSVDRMFVKVNSIGPWITHEVTDCADSKPLKRSILLGGKGALKWKFRIVALGTNGAEHESPIGYDALVDMLGRKVDERREMCKQVVFGQ